MIRATPELRASGTFSLNAAPSTVTGASFTAAPAWTSSRTTFEATNAPISSLIRRPERMTSGWWPARMASWVR